MLAQRKIKQTTVELVREDITLMEVDAFVFYAQPDLKLGTGHGTAIAQRGGPTITKELQAQAPKKPGDVVATTAGELKAKHIIHAVGPAFQEPDIEAKLRDITLASLRCAEAQGAKSVALPPMGTGFFGVPLDTSAKVVSQAIATHLAGQSGLERIAVCIQDTREVGPFSKAIEALA